MSTIFWALFYCPQMLTRSSSWFWMELKMFFGCLMNSVFGLETGCPSRAPRNELECLPSPEPADMADCGADEPSSRTGSPDQESQVSEDRWSLHQRLAVRELIDTEVSYLHLLRLCALDIRSRLQQVLELGPHTACLSRGKVGPRFWHLTSVPEAALMEGKTW